jgi:transcriptional regulator with XRE-family HTH domain
MKSSITRIGPRGPIKLHLAAWREKYHLTQQQVADRMGVSDVTVSRWETGIRRPNPAAQAAFAAAIGHHVDARDLQRHPDTPSADALLRDQPQEVVEQAIRLIQALIPMKAAK